MITKISIKNNISQILALTERNIKLNLRFKFVFVFSFISPIISILMPLIIMGQFLEFNVHFGSWNKNNYLVYIFIAYNLTILKRIIGEFSNQLRMEKFWKTLPALIIAPFNRFNLLFGIFLSHMFLISIPFIVIFILCYIYYPISIFMLIAVIIIYLLITIIFSGIGLIVGIFVIANENFWRGIGFIIDLFFFASCLSYPFEIFPHFIQSIINLNPLYYLFDFLRLMWIENNVLNTVISHPFHLLILITLSICFPCIGVYIFNIIYKKYGIVGY